MTDNPYSAPESNVAPDVKLNPLKGSGTFVLERCLSDGWNRTLAYLGLILGAALVAFTVTMLSYFTILGIFLVVPVMAWGMTRFALNVYDDCPEFSDIFSGFNDYKSKLVPCLVLALCLFGLGLLGSVVNIFGAFTENWFLELIGSLISMAFSVLIMSRFSFSYLFLVDRELPAIDALKASWDITGPIWGRMILLSIVSSIVGFLGVFALVIGMLISLPVSYMMIVSAYRQAAGRPG